MSRLAAPASVALSPADDDGPDVEVTAADQARINEFGRLNARKHELRDACAAAAARGGELADAEEAVLLADEDAPPGAFKLALGTGLFLDVSAAAAGAAVEARRARDDAAVAEAQAELRAIAARQADLKAALYAKFGRSINLEDADEAA